jgi:hypothetical protein
MIRTHQQTGGVMTKNVGCNDRIWRVIAALVLLPCLMIRPDSTRWFGLIGLLPLLTAWSPWCPLYSMLKVKTLHGADKK